ncbi:hypothetical protein NDU88_008999 [Pleurodeles waltl]|uniref:Uncharacterized protein n=1 Tax=Pleurodeles waltl TaxID=8319 RepID=A0AAV7P0Y5_PLEWA|nr:hypothetical protein NDU88_008999 [Pleurodeles waltl]
MVANPHRLPASKEEPGGCGGGTRTVKKTVADGVGGLNRSNAGGRKGKGRRNPEGECLNIVAERSAPPEA